MDYLDFDLLFRREGDHFKASVLRSPGGEANRSFSLPTGNKEFEGFFLDDGQPRRGAHGLEVPEAKIAREFGAQLYNAVFQDEIHTCLRVSLGEAKNQGAGLRIRLRMGEAPELADLPWEFLHDSRSNSFIGLNTESPIVRYLELPEVIPPLRVELPLRILVVAASPKDVPQLDVADESKRLLEATRKSRENGSLVVDMLQHATLKSLQIRLQETPVHILHFIGHGDFDEHSQTGVLYFEDELGDSRPVSGESLAILLRNHTTIRLVVLNSCKGARTSQNDPFAGVSQSLLRQRLPAAIAMQFAITDRAARAFAESFYGALARGYPVDSALVEARTALYLDELGAEWGTPVLFMRSPDGRIFDVQVPHIPLPVPHSRRMLVGVVGALVVLAASGVASWRYFHPVLKVPRLAVVGPVNTTQLAQYDYVSTAIADLMSLELTASNILNPVPREDIVQALEDIQVPPDICTLGKRGGPLYEVLGASYLIFGQFKKPDDPERKNEVHVFLCLQDSSGRNIDHYDGYADETQAPKFAAVAAEKFRQQLGPHPPPAQDYQNIFPKNPDARRLYFEGLASMRAFNSPAAQKTLEQARALEDSSPIIHAALSDTWSMLRHEEQAAKEAELALKLLQALPSHPLEYDLLFGARAEEMSHQWGAAIKDYGRLYNANQERLDYGLKLANVQILGSKTDEALGTLGKLKELGAPLGGDPRILIAESRTLQAQSKYREASTVAEKALRIAEQRHARIMQANALLELCWTRMKLGQVPEAMNACDGAKENFKVSGDTVSAAVALNDVANWLVARGSYRAAKERFEQVIAINEKNDALRDLAGALLNRANISILQNRLREAEPLLTRSLEISQRIDDAPDQAAALINLAEVSRERSDFSTWKDHAMKALQLAREMKDPSVEALALSALAQAQSESGNLPGALDGYGEVLRIRERIDEQDKIPTTRERIADTYLRMGNISKAETLSSDALQLYKKQQSSNEIALATLFLAEIHLERGLLRDAETETREAIKSFEDQKDQLSEKDALALLVRILAALGGDRLPEAQTQLDKMKALPKMDSDADIEPDPDVELDAALAEGVLFTAEGNASKGLGILRSAATEAEVSGRKFASQQLRLAAVEAQARSGDREGAKSELAKLRASAQKLGFKFITDKAAALSKSLSL